jgi:hypothetical protein
VCIIPLRGHRRLRKKGWWLVITIGKPRLPSSALSAMSCPEDNSRESCWHTFQLPVEDSIMIYKLNLHCQYVLCSTLHPQVKHNYKQIFKLKSMLKTWQVKSKGNNLLLYLFWNPSDVISLSGVEMCNTFVWENTALSLKSNYIPLKRREKNEWHCRAMAGVGPPPKPYWVTQYES